MREDGRSEHDDDRRRLGSGSGCPQVGIFISPFTLIWDFFALLFGSTYEAQTIPWLLAGFVFLYLSYPGVQRAFVENETSRLTPEQREAMEQLSRANAAAQASLAAPGMPTPPAQQQATMASSGTATAPTAEAPGLSDQLAQLAQLHGTGALSDEDYAAAKQKLG
jgi:hypothetical protein